MKNILPMKKDSAGILVGKENVAAYFVALWGECAEEVTQKKRIFAEK